MKLIASLSALAFAAAFRFEQPLVDAGVQAEQMRQASGSYKVDNKKDLGDFAPVCASISCANISCPSPFELRRAEGKHFLSKEI